MVPAAGLTLELIPPVPLPRRPGADLALVAAPAGPAVSAAAGLLRRVRRRRRPRLRRLRLDPRLPRRPPARAADRHPRAERAARAGQQAGRPAHPRRLHLLPGHPAAARPLIGLPLRRAITDLDRPARGRGPGRVRARPGPADAAGQRRLAGRGQHQRRGAGRRDDLLAAAASRCCTCSGRRIVAEQRADCRPGAPGPVYQPWPTSSRWSRRTPPPT